MTQLKFNFGICGLKPNVDDKIRLKGQLNLNGGLVNPTFIGFIGEKGLIGKIIMVMEDYYWIDFESWRFYVKEEAFEVME